MITKFLVGYNRKGDCMRLQRSFLRLYDRCVKIFRSFDCFDKDTHRDGTMYFNWVMSIVMYVFMVNEGRSNSKHFTVKSTCEGVALII